MLLYLCLYLNMFLYISGFCTCVKEKSSVQFIVGSKPVNHSSKVILSTSRTEVVGTSVLAHLSVNRIRLTEAYRGTMTYPKLLRIVLCSHYTIFFVTSNNRKIGVNVVAFVNRCVQECIPVGCVLPACA